MSPFAKANLPDPLRCHPPSTHLTADGTRFEMVTCIDELRPPMLPSVQGPIASTKPPIFRIPDPQPTSQHTPSRPQNPNSSPRSDLAFLQFVLRLPFTPPTPFVSGSCHLCDKPYHNVWSIRGPETSVQLPCGCLLGHLCARRWFDPQDGGMRRCPRCDAEVVSTDGSALKGDETVATQGVARPALPWDDGGNEAQMGIGGLKGTGPRAINVREEIGRHEHGEGEGEGEFFCLMAEKARRRAAMKKGSRMMMMMGLSSSSSSRMVRWVPGLLDWCTGRGSGRVE